MRCSPCRSKRMWPFRRCGGSASRPRKELRNLSTPSSRGFSQPPPSSGWKSWKSRKKNCLSASPGRNCKSPSWRESILNTGSLNFAAAAQMTAHSKSGWSIPLWTRSMCTTTSWCWPTTTSTAPKRSHARKLRIFWVRIWRRCLHHEASNVNILLASSFCLKASPSPLSIASSEDSFELYWRAQMFAAVEKSLRPRHAWIYFIGTPFAKATLCSYDNGHETGSNEFHRTCAAPEYFRIIILSWPDRWLYWRIHNPEICGYSCNCRGGGLLIIIEHSRSLTNETSGKLSQRLTETYCKILASLFVCVERNTFIGCSIAESWQKTMHSSSKILGHFYEDLQNHVVYFEYFHYNIDIFSTYSRKTRSDDIKISYKKLWGLLIQKDIVFFERNACCFTYFGERFNLQTQKELIAHNGKRC